MKGLKMQSKFEAAATPLPDVTDKELAGYWEGTLAGELRVQKCLSCGNLRWPPRAACAQCQSFESEWEALPQQGELFTWTVVNQTSLEGFSELAPYADILIQLDGVPVRMLGYTEADPSTLVAGERFRAKFVRKSDAVVLPIWERVPAGAAK